MVKEKEIIDDKVFDLIDRWLGTSIQKKNWISRLIGKIKSAYLLKKIYEIL